MEKRDGRPMEGGSMGDGRGDGGSIAFELAQTGARSTSAIDISIKTMELISGDFCNLSSKGALLASGAFFIW
jgi:hypothetical protein